MPKNQIRAIFWTNFEIRNWTWITVLGTWKTVNRSDYVRITFNYVRLVQKLWKYYVKKSCFLAFFGALQVFIKIPGTERKITRNHQDPQWTGGLEHGVHLNLCTFGSDHRGMIHDAEHSTTYQSGIGGKEACKWYATWDSVKTCMHGTCACDLCMGNTSIIWTWHTFLHQFVKCIW